MTDRVTKVLCQSVMAVVSVMAFLGPSLSQVFCATGCTGGQCEPPVAEIQCDLDVAGSCCDQSDACGEVPAVNPAIPRIAGDCQPCGCFDHEQITILLVPKNEGAAGAPHAMPASPGALSLGGLPLAGYPPATSCDQRTHAPPIPIYRLTHTLLI